MPSTSRGPSGRSRRSGPRSSSASPPRQRTRSAAAAPRAPGPAVTTAAGKAASTIAKRRPTTGAPGRPAPGRPSGAEDAAPRTSLTTRAAILLGVVGLLAASYAFPLRAWLDQRSELAAAEVERAELAEQVDALTEAVDRWDDPAYVRAQARERLNFVLPGEVGLVVLGTEATAAEPEVADGAVVPALEEGQPWWSGLVASFYQVGNAEPEDSQTPADPATTGNTAEPAGTATPEPAPDPAATGEPGASTP